MAKAVYSYLMAAFFVAPAAAADTTDDLRTLAALQQAQIQALKKQIASLRPADAPESITGRLALTPYKVTRLKPNPKRPLQFFVAQANEVLNFGDEYSAVIGADGWDWGSDYAWSRVAKPAGAKAVWARLTLSWAKEGAYWFHHDCAYLRREYQNRSSAWVAFDEPLALGCLAVGGTNDETPGTVTLWTKWWSTDLAPGDGWGPKRLKLALGQPNGNPGAIRKYTFAGMDIELFAEYEN